MGHYFDGHNVGHGFVRDAQGNITSFDATDNVLTSTLYQVGQSIAAIGTALPNLKFIVLDVEVCCGEFASWQASSSYSKGSL